MKCRKIVAIIGILTILLCFSQCSNISKMIGEIVTKYYESIRAFPPEGEYFCSELNVTLVFSTQHTMIRYCDGKTDEIHINYGGGFVSESGDFYALYRWNQREDQISLTIKRFPSSYEENENFLFIRTDK